MNDAPRLVPIAYFEGGTSALTIPHEAIARAEQAIAAERLVVGEHVAKVWRAIIGSRASSSRWS